ncbi:MFS transporter [Halalkalibacter okhensis]|uniref:Major facilitator superfamily (MFS) profile domain-containing protein n=1 Tax=Halalkalibacter okhensis TaxID=333138 RepID=A0A0B0I7Y5_9BACI|nr:MFS transporter [Halalkalibacter okhensis]KHF38608.1 hypothetical protein LQ50_20020 [Halalkalibacter okhensis]
MKFFYLILFIQALYSIALHGTRPIVSLYADSLGISIITIGILVSSFALIPMLLAVSIGKWLDLFGAKRISSIGAFGMLLALCIPGIIPNIATLFISQFLFGLSHLFVLVSLQKTVGNLPGNRDKLIATFSLAGSLGELLGPLISGFSYEYFGFQYTYFLAAALVLISLGFTIFTKKKAWGTTSQSPKKQSPSLVLLKDNINLRKALIVSGLVLFSKDVFVAYFPIYGKGIGMNASQIGITLSFMAAMAMVIRLLQFHLVRKFGRSIILTTTLLISGVAYMTLPFTDIPLLLIAIAIILGGGLGLGQPLSLVFALNVSPINRQGEVLGMRLMFNRGSQFIAPFLFGGIGSLAGLSSIFLVSGGILLVGAYFTRLKEEEQQESKKERMSL